MARYTTDKPGKRLMIENPEGTERYEFFTLAVQKSNLDSTIAYYRPRYNHKVKLDLGSTETTYNTSVEDGNELYKKLLADGWHKVTFETKSFA